MAQDEKVFGMSANAGRWIFVILGMVVNMCLGAVYAYSVFKKPLETMFNATATQGNLPFMAFLAMFALFTFFSGRFIDKMGPRIVMIVGGIVVGVGWILTYFASSMMMVVITYGIIGGAGVGIVYGGPVSVATKWFPDKKGLAVGLSLLGFGASAFVTAPLAKNLIAAYSNNPLPAFGIMGAGFLIVTVILSIFMRFPEAGWKPAGWNPPQAAGGPVKTFTAGQMLKTSSFYGLWLCYILGATAGLMAIGISATVGREVIGLDVGTATLLVSVFAIFNGIGRPIFGALSDKITPKGAAILSFIIIAAASFMMLSAGKGSTGLYAVAFCGFWLCLGGWLAIGPAATATFFGLEGYAQKYGVVFSAYGLGAIIGGIISGSAKDTFGSYIAAFYPTAGMAIAGIIIALLLLKPPKKA
ncbi:MAG TPA: OFA family MFS transporter [Syntrophorhabdaceae bacterium]|jgi:MFS family permease|nr:OFA family MFS transporter [Syntrophorhabdaceae bacterium]MDI9562021.1 OFA family MFS transporter [Pseudomonadota bacterium]MBV6506325.1 putative MFS-type transporter YhjX [Syntrophorhabdaceae bacterium]HNZ59200.1 OFA family MFS transporter [Syntrophorhabdaceae bacterium]HOS58697.1 OFA family MFS transporter [Syntrophorhabdaceae bacterium]